MNAYPLRHDWTEISDIISGISFLQESQEDSFPSETLTFIITDSAGARGQFQPVTVKRVYSSRKGMKCPVESGPCIVLPGNYLRLPDQYVADLGTTKISTDTTTRSSTQSEVRESDTLPHGPSFTRD